MIQSMAVNSEQVRTQVFYSWNHFVSLHPQYVDSFKGMIYHESFISNISNGDHIKIIYDILSTE